jgi:hypothetical protein
MFKVLFSVAFVLLAGSAIAAGYPNAECRIGPDKLSLSVIASNPTDTAFSCVASCRANLKGQRAFQNVDCKFTLGKNAAEKVACTESTAAPKLFTAVAPIKFTCVPKG